MFSIDDDGYATVGLPVAQGPNLKVETARSPPKTDTNKSLEYTDMPSTEEYQKVLKKFQPPPAKIAGKKIPEHWVDSKVVNVKNTTQPTTTVPGLNVAKCSHRSSQKY